MKILITGASGLLGRALFEELNKSTSNDEILGTAFSRSGNNLLKLDLRDSAAVKDTVTSFRPELIIHAAAERRPDIVKENPEAAERLNVEATKIIAETAEKTGAAVLYISTDYVFDGTKPPYKTDARTNPLNEYGRMKLAGEKAVAEKNSTPIILRVPILYGKVENLAESAVTSIALRLSRDKPSFHDNKAIRYPTHVEDVAYVISELIDRIKKGEQVKGIYHWSSETPYTKYAIARLMAEITGLPSNFVLPAAPDPDAAPRPENSHLDASILRKMGIAQETDFKRAITELLSGKF